MTEHWRKFGRNVFTRFVLIAFCLTSITHSYDYENCDAQSANLRMNFLEQTAPALVGQTVEGCSIKLVDNFAYKDPVDGSLSEKQVSPRHTLSHNAGHPSDHGGRQSRRVPPVGHW